MCSRTSSSRRVSRSRSAASPPPGPRVGSSPPGASRSTREVDRAVGQLARARVGPARDLRGAPGAGRAGGGAGRRARRCRRTRARSATGRRARWPSGGCRAATRSPWRKPITRPSRTIGVATCSPHSMTPANAWRPASSGPSGSSMTTARRRRSISRLDAADSRAAPAPPAARVSACAASPAPSPQWIASATSRPSSMRLSTQRSSASARHASAGARSTISLTGPASASRSAASWTASRTRRRSRRSSTLGGGQRVLVGRGAHRLRARGGIGSRPPPPAPPLPGSRAERASSFALAVISSR